MAADANSRKFDLVVYGASGFTGQYVVEEVARVAEAERQAGRAVAWAVAGRSQAKLEDAVKRASDHTGLALNNVGVLVADVFDTSSVQDMAKQAKVVINCVGPYAKWGEPVVEACVTNGASHVDLAGEPVFQDEMVLKYDDAAREKGVHVVSACGYDSIPADMGVLALHHAFKGGAASVEQFGLTKRGASGPRYAVNTGTMESALGISASRARHAAVSRQLAAKLPTKTPKPSFPPKPAGMFHYNAVVQRYGVPFTSDVPVVRRTQRHRFHELGQAPIAYNQYLPVKSKAQFVGMVLGLMYFFFMGMFSFTKNLVIKYPSAFTGGLFKRGGSSREALKTVRMNTVLVGKGWSEPAQPGTPPDQTKKLTVTGPDPGYEGTSTMLVASAMTILRDRDTLSRAGVVSPGFAFENTRLLERLHERGVSFTVEEV